MSRTTLSSVSERFRSQPIWMRRVLLRMVILAMLSVVGLLGLLRSAMYLRKSMMLQAEVQALADRALHVVFHRQPLGTVSAMGLASPLLRQVLLREAEPGTPECAELLSAVREQSGGVAIYLLDREGRVVTSEPSSEKPPAQGTVRSLDNCFRLAMKGRGTVYPDAGILSGERGLYYAAPVKWRPPQAREASIVGVVVLKMGLEHADAYLDGMPDPVFIVAPPGMVLASNRREWLYHGATVWKSDNKARAARGEEFGAVFPSGAPPELPFALDAETVLLERATHAVGVVQLPLAPAFGVWQIVVLRDTRAWFPAWMAAATILAVLVVCAGVSALILVRGRDRLVELANRRRIEESEARQRAILESVQAAIVTVDDANRIIVDVNQAALKMLGQSRGELVGSVCSETICPPQEGNCPFDGQQAAVPGGEQSVVLARGRELPVLRTVTPILLEGRKHLLHSFVDISALKLAQEQVSIFRRCVEASGQGFGMATLDGDITYVNPTMWELLGIERMEDVQGKPFVKYYPAGLVPRFYREILPAIMRHGHWTGEMALEAKDGRVIPAINHFFLIRDEQGRPHRLAFAITDITEQMNTAERLRKVGAQAEEANRAKSEFLANMSHEIRTPMNAIIGMTDLALDTDLTPEQRDYLKTVKVSADGLLRLLNDILDFSKIEAGQLDMSPIAFNLRDCIEDTIRTMRARSDQKGLNLRFSVADNVPPHVYGDPGRLRQILINLVGNAIKFTEIGEVFLGVGMESEREDQVELRFSIRDTGIGVPAEKREVIFDSFAQADGSTTRVYGGTGLGLAISRQLVVMMGGRIWVESPVPREDASADLPPAVGGAGSVFHFTVMLGRRPQDLEPCKASLADLRNLPVLVVDDSATGRRLLIEMLSSWHMQPTVVSGSDEALRVATAAVSQNRTFRMILLDAQMPDLDGFALADRLRQLFPREQTAIILLTSAGRRGDAARCRELDIAAYLPKPFRKSELFNCILSVLGGVGAAEERPLITRHWLRSQAQPLKILVAEDNPVNQKLAVSLLTKRGNEVTVVATGKEAVARLSTDDFDLVLMDVQMPEMDGLAATLEIRNPESPVRNHDIPVIAMTAHTMQGDKARCLESGMDDYVSKPIEADLLMETIERTLAAARQPSSRSPEPRRGVDTSKVLRLVDGNRSLLGELVGIFLESAPAMFAEIREAVEGRDAAALERTAHRLKGSVGTFGADEAARIAEALESMGRENQLESAPAACDRLGAELEMLRAGLAAIVEEEARDEAAPTAEVI